MRQCRTLVQRCIGSGAFHTSAVLLAAGASSARPRRSSARGDTQQNGSSSSTTAVADAVEIDGEEYRPTSQGYTTGAVAHARPSRRRRTPAQLLADLTDTSAKGSQGEASASAANPVGLLLEKHDVQGTASGSRSSSSPGAVSTLTSGKGGAGSGSSGGGGRGKSKKTLVTPPTKAETAAAAAAAAALSGNAKRIDDDVDDGFGTDDAAASASSSVLSGSQKALQILTNPFRGLHGDISRSYRIDQLLEVAKPEDILLARQERKSTAFSFMRFASGDAFYKGHWTSLPEMQQQLDATLAAHAPIRGASPASSPYVRGTPIPGLTLFNNDLGLQNPLVQCSYPLIVAQRLLLFPDHMRQFHAICGREDVPCDFFADIDLPGETQAGAEKALLEVLNYLEVRLPGIGFTDPFFLVLTNAVPSKEKMSYHVHARSMTYMQQRQLRAEQGIGLGEGTSSSSGSKAKKRKANSKKKKGSTDRTQLESELVEEDEEEVHQDEDEYDDLSDMVNVVDGDRKKSAGAGATKLIAFQDYRTVKLIGDEVNQTVGRDLIDANCYRPNGMLRCAFSSKLPSTQDHDFHTQQLQATDRRGAAAAAAQKRLVPLVTASEPELQRRLSNMEAVLRTMSDPEILEMTFCTRHIDHEAKVLKAVQEHAKSLAVLDSHAAKGSEAQQRSAMVLQSAMKHRYQLIRPRHILGPQAAQAVEYDAYGNVVSPFLTEGAKWRRYKAVTAKLRKLPPRAAESYDVWVRVGLALHNFSNEDNCFEEWVLFSLKSPQKYSREVCRKKWMQFERNPDALNWRRGYNYLNSTVWRQVQ